MWTAVEVEVLSLTGPTCEQLGGHVDGGPHDAAGHHGLRFAEAQVGDLGPVPLVQLEQNRFISISWNQTGLSTVHRSCCDYMNTTTDWTRLLF